MRVAVAALLLLASFSTPALTSSAAAQDRAPVERRVDSLERQMRSVQRRVFRPGEAIPDAPVVTAPANGVSDLTQRVDALERQLAAITGQVEENGNRLRTLDEASRRAQADLVARIERLEAGGAAPPAAAPAPTGDAPVPAPVPLVETGPTSTDPAENAYLAGFRLWEGKRYDEAELVLKDVVAKHPKHRRASWARNLLGRTYLDTGKPATAAEAFLANYQDLPQGDRAADSLYYLGSALMQLKKPQQACKVYDELGDVYGGSMRDYLKQNLPAARKEAKCQS